MLDEMCYDSKARPIRERKMPENLTPIEPLARDHTNAAIKTLAEIRTVPHAPARARSADAAILAQLNQRLRPSNDPSPEHAPLVASNAISSIAKPYAWSSPQRATT